MISTFTLSLDARCALANASVAIGLNEDLADELSGTALELAREVGRADPFVREAGALLAGEACLREAWREGQIDRLWDIIAFDPAVFASIGDCSYAEDIRVETLREYAAETAWLADDDDNEYCGAFVDGDTD